MDEPSIVCFTVNRVMRVNALQMSSTLGFVVLSYWRIRKLPSDLFGLPIFIRRFCPANAIPF
jgi:hypothetical protein